MYPLHEDYKTTILAFIKQLNQYPDLYVSTTQTSTVICGEYDQVMGIMQKEMKQAFGQVDQAVFVCKFLNADSIEFTD